MKKTVILGMLTCFALILSWVESLIPLTPTIPGIKLGLANLAVVLVLYLYGAKEALLVDIARVLLSSLLFGSMFTIFYSMAGALLSLFCMVLAKRSGWFSMLGVSVAGGVFHNVGQLVVAVLVVQTGQVFWYLPWLLLAGCVTGTVIGACAMAVRRHLPGKLAEEEAA